MLSNEVFDKVYTIVKQATKDLTIKNDEGEDVPKYPNLNIARSLHEVQDTKLPCVLIWQIGAPQVANDLMRNVQNGVDSTFQVESASSTSYEEAYDILCDVGDIFIQLGYSLTFGIQEILTDQPSLWRLVARFNRIVGGLDILSL